MKIKILSALLFVFCFSLGNVSCDNDEIIPEEKFIDVYSDLIIAQDTTSSVTHHQRDSIQQIIFKRYSVTLEEYSSTIEFYNSNPEKWEKFFNTAIDSLEARQKKNVR
jgi:hypothetical protein